MIDKVTDVEKQSNVLMRLAELTDQLGHTDKTIKLLDECIRTTPDFYEAYEMKINVYLESKLFAEAIAVVNQMKSVISPRNYEKLIEICGRFKEEG